MRETMIMIGQSKLPTMGVTAALSAGLTEVMTGLAGSETFVR